MNAISKGKPATKITPIAPTKLKPIKIPKIYDIPRDVQAKYNERGYKLIKK